MTEMERLTKAILCLCECMGMQAENNLRAYRQESPAYWEGDFEVAMSKATSQPTAKESNPMIETINLDMTCYNCGKELRRNYGKDEDVGILCYDTGDDSVGLEPTFYLCCMECFGERAPHQGRPPRRVACLTSNIEGR